MDDERRRQTLLEMIVDAVSASTEAIGDEMTAIRLLRAEAFLEAGLELEFFDAAAVQRIAEAIRRRETNPDVYRAAAGPGRRGI